MGNNPELDLVNVVVHTKFGQTLSICSQDIERKRNSEVKTWAVTRTCKHVQYFHVCAC